MATIDARLKELEQMAKSQRSGNIWVEMRNNRVRVDHNKRGKEQEFNNTHEASQWLEQQIDKAPGAVGSVIVTNLCDLYPDSDQLKEYIKQFITPDFDLGACLFGQLKTEGPADIKLWLMASKIYELRLYELKETEITQDQINMICGLCAIYAGGKEPLPVEDYLELIDVVGRIYA
jgi:hypothetical protein